MKIGKVYKIICSQSNDVYIGSTFNTLRDRWMEHKNRYRVYQKDPSRSMSIHKYFDKYGIENFKIILIKEYEVVDRKHLESKEQLWLNKLKNINKNSAFNVIPKLAQQISKYNYKLKNKDKIQEYYENNKNKIKEKIKEYYEKNKDKVRINQSEKKKCQICNCEVRKGAFKRHEKTKKHLQSLN